MERVCNGVGDTSIIALLPGPFCMVIFTETWLHLSLLATAVVHLVVANPSPMAVRIFQSCSSQSSQQSKIVAMRLPTILMASTTSIHEILAQRYKSLSSTAQIQSMTIRMQLLHDHQTCFLAHLRTNRNIKQSSNGLCSFQEESSSSFLRRRRLCYRRRDMKYFRRHARQGGLGP